LTASTPYAVEVAVNNEVGSGPFSASTNIITLQAVPNAAPANFAVSGVSSTFLVLVWQPLPTALANGVIIRYTITATVEGETSPSFTRTVDGSANALVLDQLDAATVYILHISATNEAGAGPQSAPLTAPRTQSSGEGVYPHIGFKTL
jgi:roundabout axon guidance receptor 2